jgi:hypothetical protein
MFLVLTVSIFLFLSANQLESRIVGKVTPINR